MEPKTKELYAAIGRGETVQYGAGGVWKDWAFDDRSTTPIPGDNRFEWRIKPTESTGESKMKPHKWAKEIKAWAEGEEIEVKTKIFPFWANIACPKWECSDGISYRIKQKTRKAIIDGVEYEFPEPLKEAPEGVESVWLVMTNGVTEMSGSNGHLFALGVYQLTREGAEAQLRAERALRGIL